MTSISKESYTKIFLKELGYDTDRTTVKSYMIEWWRNTREKKSGGLRLTDQGLDMLKTLDVELHEIDFSKGMVLTSEVIIFLDKFIDCPYYLTKKNIVVTSQRKAVELTLFAGDLRKYGLAKAVSRSRKEFDT